ncbi:hypothetical protein CPLU01_03839 [Colletotrichum plurivorum]|uniref:DUF6594 domain-containing protein n=1 Tax=Colletotrichum plurivorum TaxID=2175906 RepID=A0A8H6KRE8_9PEZI|nr:hypothetical protein CPLU01_03839 [Colletotrichum plurivorum]
MAALPLTNIEADRAGGSQPMAENATRLSQRLRTGLQNHGLGLWSSQTPALGPALDKYPAGWPRLAAEQEASENTTNHRKFGYLLQRCILDDQSRLAGLESRLYSEDHQLPIDNATADTQVSSSSARDRPPRADASSTLKEIRELLPSYHQLLFNQRAFKLLHEVKKGEYDNMYKRIRQENWLNDEDMTYLNHPDDFVNTGPDPMWLAFESFLYKLPRPILSLFDDREANGGSNAYFLPAEVFRFIYRTIAIWLSALILLVPVIVFISAKRISWYHQTKET